MPVPEKHPKIVHWEVRPDGPVVRAAAPAGATGEGSADPDVFPIIISTETPCSGFYGGQEILSHAQGAIDMSIARGGLSLYLDHGGYPINPLPDPNALIGVVEDIVRRDDSTMRGNMRFSRHELAQRCKNDWVDGTLRYVSVRAFPIRRRVTRASTDPGSLDTVTFTRWRPEEVSLVGIPGDPNAGRVRSAGSEQFTEEFTVETEEETVSPITPSQEESQMHRNANDGGAAAADPAADAAAAAAAASVTRSAGGGGVAVIERDEVARIFELCASNGMADRAADIVRRGLSVGEAGLEILAARGKAAGSSQPRNIPASAEDLGASKKELRRYRVTRALNMALEVKLGQRADEAFDGIEGEIHKELVKKLPMSSTRHGGILIPLRNEREDVEFERDRRSVTRALGSGVAGGGAELVFDRPMEMIELLTNRSLVAQFGVQIYTGLVNTIQFPKETSDVSVAFMGENPASAAPLSSPGYGSIDMSGKTMIGNVLIPRQLMALSSIDVQSRVNFRLMRQHGLKSDWAFLHAPGVGNMPTGLYVTPGVQTKSFSGAPDFDGLVDMETLVADANADGETCAYMMTVKLAGKLKKTLVKSAAGSERIWTGKLRDAEVNGYRAGATKQVSGTLSGLVDGAGTEQGLIFGDWSQGAFGYWGAFEATIDNLTKADSGQVKIVTYQMFDTVVLRPEAFCVATGATTG